MVNVLLSKTCIIHAMFETASWSTKTTEFMSRTVSTVFIACASLLECSAMTHTVRHKAHGHGHAFGLRVKAMLLAQCKLFYVKEFLITYIH